MYVLKKKYHFYAAHRNHLLQDKCANLHGHTYYVTVHLKLPKPGSNGITMLFSDVDKIVEPIVKSLDHTTLLHEEDPMCAFFREFNRAYPEHKTSYAVFAFSTSVENLARFLAERIAKSLGLLRAQVLVELQETTTSTVVYTEDAASN